MISKSRIIAGIFVFVLVFLIFSYIPLSLKDIARRLLPIQVINEVVPVMDQIVNPFLPIIGAMLAIFVALGIVLKKTKAYGFIVIVSSLLWLLYVYLALNGGHIRVLHPMLSLSVDLSFFMFMIYIPIILDLIKGILMIIKRSELKI